jgi:hypothetical protein
MTPFFVFGNPVAYVYALVQIAVVLFVIAPLLKWGKLGIKWGPGKYVLLRLPGGALALVPPLPELAVVHVLTGSPYAMAFTTATHMLVVRTLLWVPTFTLVAVLRILGYEVDLGCIDTRVDGEFAGESECAFHQKICGAFTTLTIYGLFPLMGIGAAVYAFTGVTIATDILLGWLWWLPFLFVLGKVFHQMWLSPLSDGLMMITEVFGWVITTITLRMKMVLQEAKGGHS